MSNMKLWKSVEKTDPNHTKVVNFGRKFTSIDAHYQVMRATETFGPCGEGWRYEVENDIVDLNDDTTMATSDVTLFWRFDANLDWYSYGPIRGASPLKEKKSQNKARYDDDATSQNKVRYDDDAWKKATTDALTKLLSHLGFSADVFLGKFDDNKYVATMRQEFDIAYEPEDALAFGRYLESGNNLGMFLLITSLSEMAQAQLFNLPEYGEKTKTKAKVRKMVEAGHLLMDTFVGSIYEGDALAVREIVEEMEKSEKLRLKQALEKRDGDLMEALVKLMKVGA